MSKSLSILALHTVIAFNSAYFIIPLKKSLSSTFATITTIIRIYNLVAATI